MSMQITDPVGASGRIQVSIQHLGAVEVPYAEAQVALEDLARILGFTLVDREERISLTALVDEVLDESPDDAPASAWRTLAKTLASTVADALRLENDKEV